MKLFMHIYDIDKLEWFSYERANRRKENLF